MKVIVYGDIGKGIVVVANGNHDDGSGAFSFRRRSRTDRNGEGNANAGDVIGGGENEDGKMAMVPGGQMGQNARW